MKLTVAMSVASATILIVAFACRGFKPEVIAVVDSHRTELEQQLKKLENIRTVLVTLPPLDADHVAPLDPPPRFEKISDATPLPTATFIYAEDLTDLTQFGVPVADWGRVYGADLFTHCGALLKNQKHPGESQTAHANVADEYFRKCQSIRTLFVIRRIQDEMPNFSGEILVFDLNTAKNLGGVRVSVRSGSRTDEVRVPEKKCRQFSQGTGLRPKMLDCETRWVSKQVSGDRSEFRHQKEETIEQAIRTAIPNVVWYDF